MADKRKKLIDITEDEKEIDRVKKLENENANLRQENDLLKKLQRFLEEEHQSDLDSSKDTD